MKLPELKIAVTYKNKNSESILVNSSQAVSDVAKKIFNADTIAWTEEAVMLCLSRSSHLIAYYKVSCGGMAGTVIDPKVIFSVALNACAQSIILIHNHPSGMLKPSEADNRITKKLYEAGKLLEINLLDHLIIAPDGTYFSYAEETNLIS